MSEQVPLIVSRELSGVDGIGYEFSHVVYSEDFGTVMCVRCTGEESLVSVARIPRPDERGRFMVRGNPKCLVLEESIANNVVIPVGPHEVFIRVKRKLSTRLEQRWKISWDPVHRVWHVRSSYGDPANHTGRVVDDLCHLSDEVLPWVPVSVREAAWCDILQRVASVASASTTAYSSRDSLENKRILMPHDFMTILLCRQLRQIRRVYEKTGRMKALDLFTYAFGTGNWGYGKVGVCVSMLGHNGLADVSELRKVRVGVSSSSSSGGVSAVETRHLDRSHWGFYCCVETTEGSTCGLVRQLAMSATVSNHVSFCAVYSALRSVLDPRGSAVRCLINGIFVGVLRDGFSTHVELREKLRVDLGEARSRHVCVFGSAHGLEVRCDGGRLVRPVSIGGAVMFVDSAMQYNVEFKELFRGASLGYLASLLPFSHHNQSPRSMYVLQMLKQAVMLNKSKNLWYPQFPAVAPVSEGFCVQNAVVAVLSSTGHNQEDSLILSRRAFDLGMFRHDQFRWYRGDVSDAGAGVSDRFDVDGCLFVGSTLSRGDTLCRGDGRVRMSGPVDGVVCGVELSGGSVRVRVRSTRVPQQGDKFCSLHGQKGICGIVEYPENLPYTRSGVTPDVIINPHAFPSRMTVGQILEMLFGKVCMLSGGHVDSACFSELTDAVERRAAESLRARGLSYSGKEYMWDGPTGVPLGGPVFVGVASYLRLKHMVDDKIYGRGLGGPVSALTKQPRGGRAAGGGLRVGEMEKDCLVAHGAWMALDDKLMKHSDRALSYLCDRCGMIVDLCGCGCGRGQREDRRVSAVSMCSATKLLVQELAAVNIRLKVGA